MTIRLAGGANETEGRVEIAYNGEWGTICDDLWDVNDAKVVCKQLGFSIALSAPKRAAFGRGTGTIWMDNVHCDGTEASIDDCNHNGWGDHNCEHSEDASVVCAGEARASSKALLCMWYKCSSHVLICADACNEGTMRMESTCMIVLQY